MLRLLWRMLAWRPQPAAVEPLPRSRPLQRTATLRGAVPPAVRGGVQPGSLLSIVPPHSVGAAEAFGVVPGTLTLTQLRRFHVPLVRRDSFWSRVHNPGSVFFNMALPLAYRVLSPQVIGVASVAAVTALWTWGNFYLHKNLETFKKPFLFSYVSSSMFVCFFVFLVLPDPVMVYLERRARLLAADDAHEMRDMRGTSGAKDAPVGDAPIAKTAELEPLTTWQIARLSFVFFVLYVASNFATNVAFRGDVFPSSVLVSTSGCFTLVLGWLAGVERMSVLRVFSVLLVVPAVLCILVPAHLGGDGDVGCEAAALISAVLYGAYSTFLKYAAKDESRIRFPILFAFSGLYTLFFTWPSFVALHYGNLESWELPSAAQARAVLFYAFFSGVVPAYFYNVAFACTSPLVIAIGLALMLPITLAIEYNETPNLPNLAGMAAAALLIVLSFAAVNVSDAWPRIDKYLFRLLSCRKHSRRPVPVAKSAV